MTQNDSDLRNNSEKCLYNDRGFCKFRLECRKRHFENVCEIKDCDKNAIIDTLNRANKRKDVNSWQRVSVHLAMSMILLNMTN